MNGKSWLLTGALLGGMAVILGAFGAHGLKESVPEKQLDAWEIGVRYQMYHALALMVVGLLAAMPSEWSFGRCPTNLLKAASFCFRSGVAIFSGCLYAYAVTGIKTFGAITPIGGVLLIIGWGVLVFAILKTQPSEA